MYNHASTYVKQLILFCICIAFSCSVVAANEKQASIKRGANKSVPFSLAISGGISLGSYEAGLNWALIKYLKTRREEINRNEPNRLPPELMSSVGASAGSINALISAINWCVDDTKLEKHNQSESENTPNAYRDSIEHNLFRSLWLNVGIDEMLPADKKLYGPGDGILTRTAFDDVIKQIIKILESDIFRTGCNLPIGMTVTSVDPVKMSIAGVEVENQRFMIPVNLRSAVGETQAGHIEIVSKLVNKDDPLLGNVMYLREPMSGTRQAKAIEPEHLIDAILTSSAYPIAFSKVELPHCAARSSNDETASANECPKGYQPRIDEFIDGGVFDNVPLGIAKSLAEPSELDLYSRERWQHSARPYNYIYLDPDSRRSIVNRVVGTDQDSGKEESANGVNEFMAAGIRSQLKFLGGAVSTGRNYELYNVLRGGDWTRNSYEFACQLVDVINNNSNKEDHCATKLKPAKNVCINLLKGKLDIQHKLNHKGQVTAAACLLHYALELEQIYYGYAGSEKSAESITRARLLLLSRLETLAHQSGHGQLALSIAAAKLDKLGDRRILLTRRFAPITGAMLAAFGAFIDRPFREYDYNAGVYDAIFGLADFLCNHHKDYQVCMAGQTKRIYLKLGVSSSTDANRVFYLLATHEHPDYQQSNSPWSWLVNSNYFPRQLLQGNMPIIFSALTRDFDPEQDSVYEEPEFTAFIKTLFETGYDVTDSSQFMQRMHRLKDKDPKTWYYPLTSRVSVRMLDLEQVSDDEYAALVRGAMGLGAFAVHSFIKDEEHRLLIHSAAPADSWMTWLPYEIGADFRNGGLIVSWLPGFDLSENLSLDFKITPAHLNRFAGEEIWFSQADMFLSYKRDGFFSSFGIGPTYTYTWKDWPGAKQNNIGASVYVAILQDKLRLTIGERNFNESSFAGESIYFSISVTDIPGFAYWLTKGN